MGPEVEYKHYFLGLNQKNMFYLLESRNQMGEWASDAQIQKSGKANLEGRERGAFAGSPPPEKQSRRSPLTLVTSVGSSKSIFLHVGPGPFRCADRHVNSPRHRLVGLLLDL